MLELLNGPLAGDQSYSDASDLLKTSTNFPWPDDWNSLPVLVVSFYSLTSLTCKVGPTDYCGTDGELV